MSPAKRLALVLAVLAAALLVTGAVALFVGSAAISPRAVLNALAGRAAPESVERVVTLSIRLPRILVAVLAGGALAVAGVAFQALTRNPLAEPSVLGVTSGAAFGVVIGQSVGLGWTFLEAAGLTAFAFAGALLADTLARNVVAPAELSVGVITSLCGAPFFVYLLRTRYRANL